MPFDVSNEYIGRLATLSVGVAIFRLSTLKDKSGHDLA